MLSNVGWGCIVGMAPTCSFALSKVMLIVCVVVLRRILLVALCTGGGRFGRELFVILSQGKKVSRTVEQLDRKIRLF